MIDSYIIAGMHFILSIIVGSICVCRLNLTNKFVLMRVRFGYAVLLAGFFYSAFGPYYGDWPGLAQIMTDSGVLSLLVSGSHRWKGAAPEDVKTQPAALESFKG